MKVMAKATEEGQRDTFMLDQMEMWDFSEGKRRKINECDHKIPGK